MKPIQKVVATSVILIVVFQLLYMNCTLGKSGWTLSSNNTNLVNTVSESEPTTPGRSYIFYGKLGVNPADPQGQQLCDYPSLTNCHTNSERGGSQGSAVSLSTNLKTTSFSHKMSFEFYSDGFLSKNPGAHFATGIRGKITTDANSLPVAVNGRGLIIGNMEGHPSNGENLACGHGILQIESYFGDLKLSNSSLPPNQIFPKSCTDSIFKEKTWYRIEYQVTRDAKIGFKVFAKNGALLDQNLLEDPNKYLDLNLTDFFIGQVFTEEINSADKEWSYIIQNIQFTESDKEITADYSEPLFKTLLDAKPLAPNEVATFDQIKNKNLTVGPIDPIRNRIYACASPMSQFLNGSGCREKSHFRIVLFENDESFQFTDGYLRILPDPLSNFPNNKYAFVLRTNPEKEFDQSVTFGQNY